MSEQKLHPLIKENKIFFTTGVHDALSAKAAESAGFKTVVVSGYGVAASLLGEPDIGLLTQTEIIDTARRIINAVNIHVIVDGDTGYGGVLNVMRTVKELISIGASGILLEDQIWPKRCGHMRGKEVISMKEHGQKIRAAKEVKGEREFIITARTDSLATHGIDEAIRRGKYYHEAGADIIFVDAPTSKDELKRIAEGINAPLVVNMIEGGRTPLLTLDEIYELGFISVGYPLTGTFSAARAMKRAFSHLLENGDSLGMLDEMMKFDEFTSLVGLDEKYVLDEKFNT